LLLLVQLEVGVGEGEPSQGNETLRVSERSTLRRGAG
jgi:hypothetical protein